MKEEELKKVHLLLKNKNEEISIL